MEEPNGCCTHSTFALYQRHNEFGNPLFFLASSKQACCSLGRRHYLILQGGGGLVAKLCPTLATPWTVAYQAPLSMGFLRQEHWSGLPSHSPGELPVLRIKPTSPALAGGFFITEPPGKPLILDTRQNVYSSLSSASDS